MDLKIELKKRRKELGLTMLEVAQKVGVSEGTVSRWESGDIANMRRDKIVLLAKALKVSPSFIMGWDDEDSHKVDTKPITSILSPLTPTQQKILSNCQQLNVKGQEKVLDFSDDLIDSGKYTELDREPGSRIAAHGASETKEDIQLPTEEITT